MKKILKFLCLLIIAALIAILVLKNGATADDDAVEFASLGVSPTSGLSSGDTINVTFSFGREVTSFQGTITGDENITVTSGNSFVGGAESSCTKQITISGEGSGTLTVDVNASSEAGLETPDLHYKGTVSVSIEGEEPPVEKSISISPAGPFTLTPGQTVELTAKDENGDPIGVGWSSSDANVASVSGSGQATITVTANAAGEASITAGEYMGMSASVSITVQGEEPPPPGDPLVVYPGSTMIFVGSSTEVTANKEVDWFVEGDATLSSSHGTSTTVTAGQTTGSITVTGKAGDETQSVQITVDRREGPPPTDETPSLSPTTLNLNAGGESGIISCSNVDVTWSSSNTNVAVVGGDSTSRTAVIYSKNVTSSSSATITATTSTGKTATATVNVRANEQAAPVITPSGNIKVEVGKSAFLSANQSVTWTSNNTAIATVNAEGLVIGKSEGSTSIVAKNKSGKTASINVIVVASQGGTTPAGGNTEPDSEEPAPSTSTFAISPTKTQTLDIGKTLQINVTKGTAASWKSSKPAVASVDNKGKVTANSAGTTIITAVASDGSVAQLKVRVRDENGNDPDPDSESNTDVPSTGEASTSLLLVVGTLTCIIATFIFRKKTK